MPRTQRSHVQLTLSDIRMRSAVRPFPKELFCALLLLSVASVLSTPSDTDSLAAKPAATSTFGFAFGRVGLYYRSDAPEGQAVLDLNWDQAPQHLRNQLEEFGLEVVPITSPNETELTGADAAVSNVSGGGAARGGGLHAYVLPPANGPASYTATEDMSAVASFVWGGGLVVLTEGNQGAESTRAFVQQAMGYTGEPARGPGDQGVRWKVSTGTHSGLRRTTCSVRDKSRK